LARTCVAVGAGAGLVVTTCGGLVRGRGRSAGATTRVSGRTLPAPFCDCADGAGLCSGVAGPCSIPCSVLWAVGGVAGAGLAGAGLGEDCGAVAAGGAVSVCAKADAPEAMDRAIDEPDSRRLRRTRERETYFMNGIPDRNDSAQTAPRRATRAVSESFDLFTSARFGARR
jgi:hypothetical protein